MRKRFLVILIVLAVIASLSISVSALTQTVGEENFAKVKETINDKWEDIKELIDKQTGMQEIARFEKTTNMEEATFTATETPYTEGVGYKLQNIIIEETTPKVEEKIDETLPTEMENVQTEPTEVVEIEEELEEWLRITLIETQEDDTRIFSLNNRLYTVPDVIVNEEPRVTDSGYVEKIYNVPQYFQQSYPKTNYGNYGTVSSHGCGITSIAMVFSYLLDREIMPDELAEEYGKYNTEHGSAWSLFDATAADYELEVTRVHLWQDVVEALQNGCVVISNVRENLFTAGGHFIVYYGITEDGKILVRDPNIYNFGEWSAKALKEGFYNGFEEKYVKYSFPCWVYAPKDLDAIASAAS